jgi:hypothetical protein
MVCQSVLVVPVLLAMYIAPKRGLRLGYSDLALNATKVVPRIDIVTSMVAGVSFDMRPVEQRLKPCAIEMRDANRPDERLPRVAHAGPVGNGDLGAAGGEAGSDAESSVLRVYLRLPDGLGHSGDLMSLCAITV